MAAGGVIVWQLEKAENVSSVQAVERLQASHYICFRMVIAFSWNLPAFYRTISETRMSFSVLVVHRL